MVGIHELVVREPDRGPCRAVMLTCFDYRFLRPACNLLEREDLLGTTDLIAWPGGAMALLTEDAEELLSAMELALTLHGPPTVFLVAHSDCARLGGSGRFEGLEHETARLEEGLQDAEATVRGRFPDVRIRLIRLAGDEQSEDLSPFVCGMDEMIDELTSPFPRTLEDAR